MTIFRKSLHVYTSKIAELERDLQDARTREQASERVRIQAETTMNERIAQASEEAAQRKRAEERILKLERELEEARRQAVANAAAASGSGKSRKTSSVDKDTEVDYLQVCCHDAGAALRALLFSWCLRWMLLVVNRTCRPCYAAHPAKTDTGTGSS